MKRVFVLLVIFAVGGFVQAGIVNVNSTTVNFNDASDASAFLVIRDDTPSLPNLGVGQKATGGIGGTGALEAINVGDGTGLPNSEKNPINGSNDLAAFYAPGGAANGAITLGVGDTVALSMSYKVVNPSAAATPRLGVSGFADLETLTSNWSVLDINGGKDVIGGGNGENVSGIATNISGGANKKFAIVNTFDDIVRENTVHQTDGAGTAFPVTVDSWYQFVLEITKSSAADEFDVTSTLNDLGLDGTTVNEMYTISSTLVNSSLYTETELLAGFTFVTGKTADSTSNEYDDFTVTVTTVVPEPATMALLGLGSLVLVRRKK